MSGLEKLLSSFGTRSGPKGGVVLETHTGDEGADYDPCVLLAMDTGTAKALGDICDHVKRNLEPLGAYGITMRAPKGVAAVPFNIDECVDGDGIAFDGSKCTQLGNVEEGIKKAAAADSGSFDPVEFYAGPNYLIFTVYDKHTDMRWTAEISPAELHETIGLMSADGGIAMGAIRDADKPEM